MSLVDNYIPVRGHEYDGGIVNEVTANGFGPNWARLRRPFLDAHDRPSVVIHNGRFTNEKGERKPVLEKVYLHELARNGLGNVTAVHNATSLRKEEWLQLDEQVLRAARFRLRAWADLSAANSFGGFNGMAKLVLEHETMSDPGEALVDMDGLTEGRTDSPKYQLEGLPLPITHSDFWYSSRRLAVSRSTGTPLDTTSGEAAGRRVAETIEKTTIGNQTGITYGGNSTQVGGYSRTSKVYGYLNFTPRLTKTNIRRPDTAPWVAAQTLADFLACLDQLKANRFFGPFMVYTSNDWDQYLDGDYILTGGNVATQTLRERLKRIDGITDVRRLDFLFASVPDSNTSNTTSFKGPGGENVTSANVFTLIFVQMTPDVARAVNGMDITTVQWESVGGMRVNFKVMAISVPQLRADFYGNCGVLQATPA